MDPFVPLPVLPVRNAPNILDGNAKEPDAFKIERDDGDTFVRLLNPNLINALRRYVRRESLYDLNPKVIIILSTYSSDKNDF
jgi:hypothetical protein